MNYTMYKAIHKTEELLPVNAQLSVMSQVGSRAYGTSSDASDWDFKGVYVAPTSAFVRLSGDSLTRPVRFQTDELDVTVYELRQFYQLAAKANPTALEILWSPCKENITGGCGHVLHRTRPHFLSSLARVTYLGYAQSCHKSALDKTTTNQRKFKMHSLRLLDAGLHLLQTEEVMVKHPDPGWLRAMADKPISVYTKMFDQRVEALINASTELPDKPDEALLDTAMLSMRDRLSL